jgi:PAS domain S-box-containing protein
MSTNLESNGGAPGSLISLVSLSEENSQFEKYASLVSILNGFEEYTLDRSGHIISSNLEAVNITGYDEWEVIGKHISIFYSLEDQVSGRPQSDLERAEKKSPMVTTGLRVKKKNPAFWARIEIRALTENEALVGYKMTVQDATHKAVIDHRVREFKDEYLSLFNNSFVGIFKFSMNDYSMLMINEKAEKTLEVPTNGGLRPLFHEVFDKHDDFLYLIKYLREHKRIEDFEFQLKGRQRWVRLSCRYFASRNFVEGILIDFTESRKSHNELDRLNNELDQFIYHASHELRSPLMSMLGIINLIKVDKTGDAGSLADTLKGQVTQLDYIMKCISAIAFNNHAPIGEESIEWEDLAWSILKEFQPVDIKVSLDVRQSSSFKGDIVRLRTILMNLISNSVKYYNKLSETAWVKILIISDKHQARLVVEDNGIGIEQKYLKDIFKMFYKATEYPKGPGLGLYLVKAITDKIGGTIRVTSTIGKGTIFEIDLPNKYE